MSEVTIVVPCFDEASRLQPESFVELARLAEARVLMVDDGSTDGTGPRLEEISRAHPGVIDVMSITRNSGKAEAVRRGLLQARRDGALIVGYLDADLATPVEEMARLVGVLRDDPQLTAVFASRVGLLGHGIQRSAVRHYLGRVFATASSAVLGLRVYDTQCGAKVFRGGAALDTAIGSPFHSRWAFDVELIGRLVRSPDGVTADRLLEVPLQRWTDVGGSKLGVVASANAAADLVRIQRSLSRLRPRRRAPGTPRP